MCKSIYCESVNLVDLLLYVTCCFSLTAFTILCSFTFTTIWHKEFIILPSLVFSILNASCTSTDISSPRNGKFSTIILLKMFSMLLAWNYFPFMPKIYRFVLFRVIHRSNVFPSYILINLSFSLTECSNFSTSSLLW